MEVMTREQELPVLGRKIPIWGEIVKRKSIGDDARGSLRTSAMVQGVETGWTLSLAQLGGTYETVHGGVALLAFAAAWFAWFRSGVQNHGKVE